MDEEIKEMVLNYAAEAGIAVAEARLFNKPEIGVVEHKWTDRLIRLFPWLKDDIAKAFVSSYYDAYYVKGTEGTE